MRLVKLLLLGAILWSLYWFGAEFALRLGISAWFDGRAAQGWQAEYSDISTGGFPLRHVTTLDNPALADPANGTAWQSDFISFDSPAIWPGRQTLRFAQTPQYLSYYDQTIALIASEMVAELHLQAGLALELERMTLTAGPWQIRDDADQVMAAQSLVLAMVQTEQPETYAIDVNATQFTPGHKIRRLIRSADSLPPDFQTLQMDMTVEFDQAWDRMALEQRRPQPVRIDLDLAEAQWGELRLFATGAVTIDRNGIPTGEVAIKAENWREMLTMAQAAGAIPEQMVNPIESVLKMLAGLGGKSTSLDVTLKFRDGKTVIGPFPIGSAPRIMLR